MRLSIFSNSAPAGAAVMARSLDSSMQSDPSSAVPCGSSSTMTSQADVKYQFQSVLQRHHNTVTAGSGFSVSAAIACPRAMIAATGPSIFSVDRFLSGRMYSFGSM